jgi:hypothetical protein
MLKLIGYEFLLVVDKDMSGYVEHLLRASELDNIWPVTTCTLRTRCCALGIYCVQTGSGDNPASYTWDNRGSSGGKTADAWSWSLNVRCPGCECMELYFTHLHVFIKCTLVQALRLCKGRTAHRGSRGIALLFYYHDTRRGWGVSVTPRPLFTPGKDPVLIVQEAGWAPGPVWTGAENLAATGIRSPDRPARSQLLYQLRYPAHTYTYLWPGA